MGYAREPTGLYPSSGRRGWWWRGGAAAGFGRLLGAGSLAAAVLALVALHPPIRWALLLAIVGSYGALFWLSFALPWGRWSPGALAAFPLTAMALLVLITEAAPGVAGVLGAFFILSFAYAGLFLPARSSVLLLVPALPAYFAVLRMISPALVLRACFLAISWVILGELLGRLQRRQLALIRQLSLDSHTDLLTGLANRRGMAQFLADAEPGDVVMTLDLDAFKRLNDERGHAAGDAVLTALGQVIAGQLRTEDRAARSGGEEVVILLRSGDARLAAQVDQRLRQQLAHRCPGVSFSAGVAIVDTHRPVYEALQAADEALYEAKRAGRAQTWTARDVPAGVPSAQLLQTAGPPLI